jgi:hypothetical protein
MEQEKIVGETGERGIIETCLQAKYASGFRLALVVVG